MSSPDARYYVRKTRLKYQLLRFTELVLQSVAVGLLILSITMLIPIKGVIAILAAVIVALAFLVFRGRELRIADVTNSGIVNYLNRHYPALEEGADLIILDDEKLTSIQQLQKNRSLEHFESIYPSIKLPNKLVQAAMICAASVLVYVLMGSIKINQSPIETPSMKTSGTEPVTQNIASIQLSSVNIFPPDYTNLPRTTTSDLNIRVPEGSRVQWNVRFSGPVIDPRIVFSSNDSLPLTNGDDGFHIQRPVNTPLFYQLKWKSENSQNKSSDYFQIEIVKDQSPTIVVENLNQFTEYDYSNNLKTELLSTISDDYGLRDAYIIATVSKGSGEAIKFRELRMPFSKPSTISGTALKTSLVLDLLKLGLDPGDELYFYVEALDNKAPVPNRGRTETYFISLRDTAAQITMTDPGLGVDLMPEYFRSQRQIIIDSEKLLKERKHISKEAFNSRSNALAYDQKVLRLRYGEFLGEEFESGIGLHADINSDGVDHKDEDVSKQYGHVHDKDNEHNLIEEKKSAAKNSHDHNDETNKDDDPTKAYVHNHDNQEEASFFTQSIRAKLKAAITIMWDAELHLRLYDPQKSLPFQYKALKLLKEISQDSRVYVHRSGFDPPPLKEEKRLTADLSEIVDSKQQFDSKVNDSYPAIRKAFLETERLLGSEQIQIGPATKSTLEAAGQELASIAIHQPGRYLKSLSLIKGLTQNELNSLQIRSALLEIRKSLWYAIPPETRAPQALLQPSHPLDEQFLNDLESLKRQ